MKPADVSRFRGLNNVSDPMRLDAGWLTVARNVHVTDQDAIERREGASRCTPPARSRPPTARATTSACTT